MSSDYETYFQKFHAQRLSSLNPEAAPKCSGCTKPMTYHSTSETLTLSCGSKGKGKCGEQYVITLPQYIRYSSEMKHLYSLANGTRYSDDPRDLSTYPLQTLQKLIKMTGEFASETEDQAERMKDAVKELSDLRKGYEDTNNLKAYKETIKELHGIRKTIHRKRLKLMKQIRNEHDLSKRKALMREYASYSQRDSDILPLIDTLNEPMNEYVMVKEGSVKKLNDTYEIVEKPKKPRKPRKKPEKQVAKENVVE